VVGRFGAAVSATAVVNLIPMPVASFKVRCIIVTAADLLANAGKQQLPRMFSFKRSDFYNTRNSDWSWEYSNHLHCFEDGV